MSDKLDAGKRSGPGSSRDARRDRLRLALRENLKRRKAQARGRRDAGTDSDGDAPATEQDKSEPPARSR